MLGIIIAPLIKPSVDIVGNRRKLGIDISVAGSGRVSEVDKLAHDGIKIVLRGVIVRALIATGPETENVGLKLGQRGYKALGLLGGKLPLGGEGADVGVTISVDPVVERLIGCKVYALHGKSPFRWCAAFAALCLCDGFMIPPLCRQRNIGKIHKVKI